MKNLVQTFQFHHLKVITLMVKMDKAPFDFIELKILSEWQVRIMF